LPAPTPGGNNEAPQFFAPGRKRRGAAVGAAHRSRASLPGASDPLIVGFPAGGQVDITARVAAQWLGNALGQTVVSRTSPAPAAIWAPKRSSTPRRTATRCSSPRRRIP